MNSSEANEQELVERVSRYLDALPDEFRYKSPNEMIALLDECLAALTPVKDAEVKEPVSATVRAFWRRIYPFRNRYERELPDPLPVEFEAHMTTALTLMRESDAKRIEELEANERAGRGCNLCNWIERDVCVEEKDALKAKVSRYEKALIEAKEEIERHDRLTLREQLTDCQRPIWEAIVRKFITTAEQLKQEDGDGMV